MVVALSTYSKQRCVQTAVQATFCLLPDSQAYCIFSLQKKPCIFIKLYSYLPRWTGRQIPLRPPPQTIRGGFVVLDENILNCRDVLRPTLCIWRRQEFDRSAAGTQRHLLYVANVTTVCYRTSTCQFGLNNLFNMALKIILGLLSL